jgi:DNA-binding response OmpR family regulator
MDFQNRKPKVLFIEDDMTLSSLFTMRMTREGFEVLNVNDGETALQQAKEYRPDLVVVDLMMPNLSGYDVIDILRNTMETSTTKIVVLSALSQPEDIDKAKKLGADDYIVKSQMVVDDIMDRLREHLGMGPSTLRSGLS